MEINDNTFKTSLPSTQTNGGKPLAKTDEDMADDSEDLYNNKLSELNKCFFNHINGYMKRSEFFDFTQVCKEYIDYHKKIESETKPEALSGSKSQMITSSQQSSQSSAFSSAQTSTLKSSGFGSQQTFASSKQ